MHFLVEKRPSMPTHRLPSMGPALDLDGDLTPKSARPRTRSTPTLLSCSSAVSTLSSSWPRPLTRMPTLLNVISHRRVLASLLKQLGWHACWALLSTCRESRDFFSYSELKDVILSRFVPGYSACLRISDPLRMRNVPISLADLNLLLISQAVILHRYPMHALICISRLGPEVEPVGWERTLKLVTLTQAHSRFVLLLQALAHSSTVPPSEKEEFDSRPRSAEPKLRQLTFPAPLSYASPTIVATPTSPPPSIHSRNGTDSSPTDKYSRLQRKLSRSRPLSLFGIGIKAPPPPVSEPRSLKHYTLGWRHSVSRASRSASDDEWDEWGRKPLERPQRRFASANLSSRSSSSSSSPSPPFSRQPTLELSSPARRSIAHHDLNLATSRTRAPILRVFVPCSKMDLSGGLDSIEQCEDQLHESGLWHHLSTGDIICNLGYVPPSTPEEPESSSDGSLPDSAGSEHRLQNRRKWLIFNGESLCPFSPPESIPLRNVFILPSPFYYTHIMPPHSDPVFTVRCFPACTDIPQLTLVSLSRKVRSPHSPTGYALVKKPMWIARVWKQVAQDDEIGLGWQGEWVCEGPGTPEGQKLLLDCLRGVRGPRREWQLIREKCSGDRLWFRLIKTLPSKKRNNITKQID
ncbi:hypothetical protein C8R45DRAFT_334662 [Mycena sanguinolenta]|nr:hypothetical protein C8R45DRAFT_334662 [Mycena sanguinolenta]